MELIHITVNKIYENDLFTYLSFKIKIKEKHIYLKFWFFFLITKRFWDRLVYPLRTDVRAFNMIFSQIPLEPATCSCRLCFRYTYTTHIHNTIMYISKKFKQNLTCCDIQFRAFNLFCWYQTGHHEDIVHDSYSSSLMTAPPWFLKRQVTEKKHSSW